MSCCCHHNSNDDGAYDSPYCRSSSIALAYSLIWDRHVCTVCLFGDPIRSSCIIFGPTWLWQLVWLTRNDDLDGREKDERTQTTLKAATMSLRIVFQSRSTPRLQQANP